MKLTKHWNDKRPVPWNKVSYLLPHVNFTHKRPIERGFDCVVCHGEVKHKDNIRQVKLLRMG